MAPPEGQRWEVLWYSEHPRYGGCGAPPFESDNQWRIPGHAAIVLRPSQRIHRRAADVARLRIARAAFVAGRIERQLAIGFGQ